ncbi:MAG TPA: DUF6498-containing protein [Chitinophagaceae bacterium]|nr:DUF6498-containing protein [Chitinophagaceae bacterium]
MLKRKLTVSELALLLANLLPVFGVWFLGWNPTEAFIVYALETLIVGILTILKMLIVTFTRHSDEWPANGKVTQQSGFFFIFFFIFHFGLFALVQTTIFSQSAGITPPGSGMMHFFFKWYTYINEDIAYMLGAFIVGYIAKSLIPFIFNGEYKTAPLIVIMFQPYGRIFIQQFTVIIGSMFLTLGFGKVFILIFTIVKIGFEIFIDYDRLLGKAMSDLKRNSSQK